MRDGNFDVEQHVRTGSLCPGDPVGERDRPEHDRNDEHDRDDRREAERGERQKDHARHETDRDAERLVREGPAEPRERHGQTSACVIASAWERAVALGGPFVSGDLHDDPHDRGGTGRRGTGRAGLS